MSCSGFSKWSGWSSTELTTVKIALFAPMPKPRARTETHANPGLRPKVRRAYRRSREMEVSMDSLSEICWTNGKGRRLANECAGTGGD